MGTVYLIGAGPGDPGLITVRGLDRLASADVVVYDHRVDVRVLRHARAGAEVIDVGAAAPPPIELEAICYLLAEKAREGRSIARLKWGDPFFFDHGGSEALFLHQQGIPFEVVPGVVAAVAWPAYAGVPVTVPDGGNAVTVIRGPHGAAPVAGWTDWSALARLDGTIVCAARASDLRPVAEALLAHGRAPGEPAAIVFDGTLASQRTAAGTLETIGSDASDERRPAVLVVGRGAALRDHLRWYDARPLFGKRILVTRALERADELVERLEAAGAESVVAPMIRIEPPDDYGPLDAACARLEQFDWVVFASASAVDPVLERLLAGPRDLRAFGSTKLCAVGPSTAARLRRYGLKVDLVPAEYRAEALIEAIRQVEPVRGLRLLLPHADIGRQLVAEDMRRHGADVVEVVAYRTVAPDADRDGEPDVYRLLLEHRLDVVTFASPSAVRNLVQVLGAEPAADLLNATVVAAIGPVTAEAAAQHGIRTAIVPEQYTIPGLVTAIVEYFRHEPD